jgi:UDP-N-acetylmuramate--alanine ligase
MQPHRYSRLNDLFEEFSTSFNDADTVIILDVYSAGETPVEGADSPSLARAIQDCGHRDVKYLQNVKELPQIIGQIAEEGDLVICLGAGDITALANDLPARLESFFNRQTARTA